MDPFGATIADRTKFLRNIDVAKIIVAPPSCLFVGVSGRTTKVIMKPSGINLAGVYHCS